MVLKELLKDVQLNMFRLFMDRDRIYASYYKFTPSYTWIRPMTRFLLNNYQKTDLIGVEIGVNYGLNAKNMLKFLPLKQLFLIDPYIETLDTVSGEKRYQKAQRYLSRYSNKTQFIRRKSEDAVNDLPDNLDFVYIDGNHTYEYTLRDIELYFPKILEGGIIGGHDFWGNGVDVCRAVLDFADKHNLIVNGELTDWWIVKRLSD